MRDILLIHPERRMSTMNLEDMPSKVLLAKHNELAEKPAGPKSFKNKADLIARIRSLEPPKRTQRQKKPDDEPTKKAKATEASDAPKKSRVGELARRILIDPCGVPFEDVAMFVNHFIPGAKATAQSVSWYASKMRKEGIDVPKRVPLGSICVWLEHPETCDRWLADCGIRKQGS
jgi:hypothetical protein